MEEKVVYCGRNLRVVVTGFKKEITIDFNYLRTVWVEDKVTLDLVLEVKGTVYRVRAVFWRSSDTDGFVAARINSLVSYYANAGVEDVFDEEELKAMDTALGKATDVKMNLLKFVVSIMSDRYTLKDVKLLEEEEA